MAVDPIGAQDRLRRALIGVDADLVIIDCPPSLGLLTINGLFAADHAVIVTEPSAWAVDGVAQILRNISRIAERRKDEFGQLYEVFDAMAAALQDRQSLSPNDTYGSVTTTTQITSYKPVTVNRPATVVTKASPDSTEAKPPAA